MNPNPFTLTVRYRSYHVQPHLSQQKVVVTGPFYGEGSRLYPGLLDKLQQELNGRGYPVETSPVAMDKGYSWINQYQEPLTLHLIFTPYKVSQHLQEAFAQLVLEDDVAQATIAQTTDISRRYHLARQVGIYLDPQEYLYGPIEDYEAIYHHACDHLWQAFFQHPLKPLAEQPIRLPFTFTDYASHQQPIHANAEDRHWLRTHTTAINLRIDKWPGLKDTTPVARTPVPLSTDSSETLEPLLLRYVHDVGEDHPLTRAVIQDLYTVQREEHYDTEARS
jgi:hypothetical protein